MLVEPARSENVGTAARALNTMGFPVALRLVNPQTEVTADRARWTAHGSHHVLDGAEHFNSVEDAVADADLVVGTTARRRGSRTVYLGLRELAESLPDRVTKEGTVALLFGREESGLSNSELDLCQIVSSIPMRKAYPSLNLGQAVMVYAYELSRFAFEPAEAVSRDASAESLRALVDKTRELLDWLELDPGRALYRRIVERVGLLKSQDARLLHSVLNELRNRTNY